ncbi:MAG: undecaprenyl/decaprenyl-phosphate alpha-N-acetylglucosaminyl 1-phosphate transferase [Anaerolineaceae bacterium]|nr:undecaprenyl/decaprenyl-phosphate alpha-N-acetylglucosaminyl 1-phosphate transferase [Anaerolineaceae bacterium]
MSIHLSEISYMFTCILVGIVVSFILSLLCIWIAKKLKLLDMPGFAPHKLHKKPTPFAGGMTLVFSYFILAAGFNLFQNQEISDLSIPIIIIFLIGFVDDIIGLSAPVKLLGQLSASLLVIWSGTSIHILEDSNFFLGGSHQVFIWLDYLITILWLVGITNAFNLVDSMDGLATGLAGWALGFFMLAAFESTQFTIAVFSALLLGISIGILFFNNYPAKMFLGDSGAQTYGFILAFLGIAYDPLGSFQRSSWFIPILLLGVPIFDTTLVTISRIRRGVPFYIGSNDHTYHRLRKMGLESQRAVQLIQISAFSLECLAFIAVSKTPFLANLIFFLCVGLGVICLIVLEHPRIIKSNR